jgi:hypothetical protein
MTRYPWNYTYIINIPKYRRHTTIFGSSFAEILCLLIFVISIYFDFSFSFTISGFSSDHTSGHSNTLLLYSASNL